MKVMAMSPSEIFAADFAARTSGVKSRMQQAFEQVDSIKTLIDRMVGAVRPNGGDAAEDWEFIYSVLFSIDDQGIKLRTKAALDVIDWEFPDYYDPDTTYEEDSRAWIEAFKELHSKIAEALD